MLLDKRVELEPFEYSEAYDFWLRHQYSYWNHTRISFHNDIHDFKYKLTDKQRSVIGNTLKSFTQLELVVGNEYWSQRPARWFPKPEIQMMCLEFSAREMIHAIAYSQVDTNLGIKDYKGFLREPTVSAKLESLMVPGNTNQEKALSLAIFSAFAEGVNLFSSFAILLNFSRFDLMKGLGKLINYSILDECFTEGTEILTSTGWKDFRELSYSDKVAQFDRETQDIDFVEPERIIDKQASGDIYRFFSQKGNVDISVTAGHDMLYRFDYDEKKYRKQKASEIKVRQPKKLMPKAGYKLGGRDSMHDYERFLVMAQADGSVSDRYTGANCGTVPIRFGFAKERKISRFLDMMGRLGWDFIEDTPYKNRRNFRVSVPVEIADRGVKSLEWVDLSDVSHKWCKEFIEEISHWDGHVSDEYNYIYYSSKIEKNADIVQAVATVSGMSSTKGIQVDDRKDSFSDMHRIWIYPGKDEMRCGVVKKEKVEYSGKVYCVTVPKGSIVVRNNSRVIITGNCEHSAAGCWLFRTFANEYNLYTPDLKKAIYDAARYSVKLEDDFLDKVFELGDIPGITKHQVKQFIRARANQKLNELGLKNNWKNLDRDAVDEIDLWFTVHSAGERDTDFFAGRVTGGYAKGNKDWSKMWDGINVQSK